MPTSKEKSMKVYVVYEYAVIELEFEECFRIMSVHSSEEKAKEAIAGYEEVAKQWKKCRAEYSYEEYTLDGNYYCEVTEETT
jgi:hypothetical protein